MLFKQKQSLNSSDLANDSLGEYKIRPQDILQVRNLQDANKYLINSSPNPAINANPLSNNNGAGNNAIDQSNYQVADDGTVILPAIGHIKVAGYTRSDAEKLIEETYRKNVLVNPIIELRIVNLKVTILGEVRVAGNYPLTKEHTTLVEMIGAAGGITERADETNVEIIRGTEKKPKLIQVNLGDIDAASDTRTYLQNGDIIYVGQNKRAARSDNLQSVSTIVQPSLLIINAALIILTLFRK
ncbi:MAG: polysaccharide biosynthesis/export family protein [Bacteroidota bacterium]